MKIKFEDLKENGVEEWAKILDSEPKTTPLSREASERVIYLMMRKDILENDEQTTKFFEESFVAKVFWSRIRTCHDYEITKCGMLFLLIALENFNLATSTMMANYLQYISKTKGIKKFDVDILMRDIFPLGMFSEETLQNAWGLQKVQADATHPNDNMLDYAFCCSSINDRF